MTSALRQIIRVLAAALASLGIWTGVWTHAEASALPLTPTVTYVYDGNHHSATSTDATPDRGPPATYGQNTTYDAVDRMSQGASAGPERTTRLAATSYDQCGQFAQFAGGPGTAEEKPRGLPPVWLTLGVDGS